ncbi:MAG: hypothetical protein N2378_11835 [Chloroflexaceae bacterium]|nr:hypothetical protein [Chloroflexaceae bacterium]
MRTIETIITVLPDGSIRIPPQPDLKPGDHRALLVIEEPATSQTSQTSQPLPGLKMLDIPGWPVDSTFRREDMYDDRQR